MASNGSNDQSVPRGEAGDVTLERDGTMFQHGAISATERTGPRTRSQSGITTQPPARLTEEPSAPTTPRRNQRPIGRPSNDANAALASIRQIINNLPEADRTTLLNDLNADHAQTSNATTSNPSTSTTPTTNNVDTPIPYVKLNAGNYGLYNIDFTKFDRDEYTSAKLKNKIVTNGIKNLPKPPTLHSTDAEDDLISFLIWYRTLEASLREIGLATFVFDKEYKERTANDLEKAENSFVGGFLRPMFAEANKTIGYMSNTSTYFQAVLDQYLPYQTNPITKKLVENIDISYTCAPRAIVSTFEAIQTLSQIKKHTPFPEKTYIAEVMDKAHENFDTSFNHDYAKYTDNPSTYDIDKITKVITRHIANSSKKAKLNAPIFHSAHKTHSTFNIQGEQHPSKKRRRNNHHNDRYNDKQRRYPDRQNKGRNESNLDDHNQDSYHNGATKSNYSNHIQGTNFIRPHNKIFSPPEEGISPIFP